MEKKFEIKMYGKSELAMLYSPNDTEHTALKRLARYICRTPGLLDSLKTTGYNQRAHTFTPRQVEIIVNAIGEP